MNRIETFYQRIFDDIKTETNLGELVARTNQLVGQAIGWVRDCYIIEAQRYVIGRIAKEARTQ